MKKIILLAGIVLSSAMGFAQSNVYLEIFHMLGPDAFGMNAPATNNLNQDFKVNRLEYYISEINVSYNNGMDTTISDLWVLADAAEETKVLLGNWDVNSISLIEFGVGVDVDHNHLDPSTYATDHPLAHQTPSMHWGWTSGYRFVAMEGTCNTGFTQIFEVHALGDANYKKAALILSDVKEVNGDFYIQIEADYIEALRDLDLNGGLIVHSETGEAEDIMNNFGATVFKEGPGPTYISEKAAPETLGVYPNPVQKNAPLYLNGAAVETDLIEVMDINGRVLIREAYQGQSAIQQQLQPGLYLLRTLSGKETLSLDKFVVVQ